MRKEVQVYLEQIKKDFSLEIGKVNIHDGGENFYVLEINSEWMFRFPRDRVSQSAMEMEIKLLHRLREDSLVTIPDYRYLADNYGGYSKIDGSPLTSERYQSLSGQGKAYLAKLLGEFLSGVHLFPVDDLLAMGGQRGWNGEHQKAGEYFLANVSKRLSSTARRHSRACMEELLASVFTESVIHGDFYFPDHVFWDEDNRTLGVIDFADVTIYDPAHDFQCLLEIGGEKFFDMVLQYYQPAVDEALLHRSLLRLQARPLFSAGHIFRQGREDMYTFWLNLIDQEFG